MVVLFGRVILAGPWPSSRLFVPVMVVTGLFDGNISWKYFLCFRIVCDVPLSSMHMLSSDREVMDFAVISMCILGCGEGSWNLVRSSSISR